MSATWTDLLLPSSYSAFLVKAYGAAPSLKDVEVGQIELDGYWNSLSIRVHLSEFPQNPPRGWEKYSTVTVSIFFDTLLTVRLERFQQKELSSMAIRKDADGISCNVSGGTDLRCESRFAYIGKLSASLSERRQPPGLH